MPCWQRDGGKSPRDRTGMESGPDVAAFCLVIPPRQRAGQRATVSGRSAERPGASDHVSQLSIEEYLISATFYSGPPSLPICRPTIREAEGCSRNILANQPSAMEASSM